MDDLLKISGGLIAIGTVIYLAGKVRQIVDFLRESVEILREEAKTFRETLIDHGERLVVIETQSKIKRRKK